MLNPNGMIASVDTDKHVSSPEWNPADVHSLCRTSRALSVRFVGRLWYISSTFTSEGFWEIKPILGWHGVLSLQPVLCFSVSKGAGRGSDGLRCPCPPVSAHPSCVLWPTALDLWRGPRSAGVCPLALWSGDETAGYHYSWSASDCTVWVSVDEAV